MSLLGHHKSRIFCLEGNGGWNLHRGHLGGEQQYGIVWLSLGLFGTGPAYEPRWKQRTWPAPGGSGAHVLYFVLEKSNFYGIIHTRFQNNGQEMGETVRLVSVIGSQPTPDPL